MLTAPLAFFGQYLGSGPVQQLRTLRKYWFGQAQTLSLGKAGLLPATVHQQIVNGDINAELGSGSHGFDLLTQRTSRGRA